MNFKRLSLTDIVIEINRVPKKKALIEAMEKAGECGFSMCNAFEILYGVCNLILESVCRREEQVGEELVG